MRYPARICHFPGTRTGEHPPARTKCELRHTMGKGRGCKPAVEYASYVWGSAALCEKHIAEECGAKETTR